MYHIYKNNTSLQTFNNDVVIMGYKMAPDVFSLLEKMDDVFF